MSPVMSPAAVMSQSAIRGPPPSTPFYSYSLLIFLMLSSSQVHERTAHVDFLMALLRDRVRLRDLMRPSSEKGEERGKGTHHRLKLILMSATLDGAKLSSYFGNCPILSASGRTFPIKQVFLEQAYEEMADGYVLSEDSEAAFRPRYSYNKKGLGGEEGKQGQRAVKEGGPDGSISSLGHNHYDSSLYPHDSYGSRTRLNLSRVDESKIDYDLIECLIAHVDEKVIGTQVGIHELPIDDHEPLIITSC